MQNVCRTCMGDSVPLVNIFSDILDPALEQPQRNLSYIISECTNRQVRRFGEDCQPQFICLNCVKAAQTAFRFKRQCDRSYHRFCELQNNEGEQDPDTKKGEHKKATRAKDSMPDLSPARHAGNNNIQTKLCQTPNGTERTQNIYNVVDNRFVCFHCPNTYKYKGGLRRHLRTHSSKPDHKCPYCSKVFWRRDTYIGHLLTHGIRSPVSCNQCPTVCPDATHLKIHMREHNGGAVGKTLSVPNDLNLKADIIDVINKEISLNARAENMETVYKNLCNLCSHSFINEDDLKIHRNLDHNINVTNPAEKSGSLGLDLEQQRLDLSLESSTEASEEDIPTSRQAESGFYQESISGQETPSHSKFLRKEKKYKSGKYMHQHQATHFSKPKHICSVCSKPFWQRSRLRRHLRTHDKEGPYPCRLCSAIFVDHIQFKMHLREHEEKIVGEKFPKVLNPSQESSSTIDDDSSIQGSEDNPTSSQIESGFDQEDTTSSGQGEKRNKLSNSEEKRVECPICQSTYKYKRGLWKHHQNKHTLKSKKYTCSICSRSFVERNKLNRHKRNVHKNLNILSCMYCAKEYKSKTALKNHEKKRKCA